MSCLEVSDLTVAFGEGPGAVVACRHVGFSLPAGMRLALVGESGSGKTTIAMALMGMLRPPGRILGGSALLDGTDLLALRGEARRRHRLAVASYVPQGAMNSLNPVLRVRDQMLHGFADHDMTLVEGAAEERVAELLDMVDLPRRVADMYPHELSGGMKQRVCIALAVALRPRLLIADEPTSALDVITQRQVMDALGRSQRLLGSALILIAHDMGLVAQFADQVLVMRQGAVIEHGTVRDVFTAPAHAYTRELIDSAPRSGARGKPAMASADSGVPLLEFEGVSKSFGGGSSRRSTSPALRSLTFRLSERPAVAVAIVGQSGSGKTTLASLALGLQEPTAGRVLYRGHPLATMRRTERLAFRREVQAVFQDPYAAFNPFYRVDRALEAPLRRFGVAASRSEARRLAAAACEEVGLDAAAVLGRFPHELSGGQRQRLMIARALALRPRLLVADEPVSMVDASLRASILASLARLRDRHGIPILYITHDLATAHQLADYVLVMQAGSVVEAGAPDAVIGDPAHPYTRELVAAVPWADPDRPWGAPPAARPPVAPGPSLVRTRLAAFTLEAA